jgi:mono/diheme cytochrome c family protein
MDYQAKFKAQSLSLNLPEGTVAWGDKSALYNNKLRENELKSDNAFYSGKNSSGNWVKTIPIDVTEQLLNEGQKRFNIFCASCHDKSGSGKGIVIERGFAPPPSFHDERILNSEDGYIFEVISNGVRNMSGYGKSISENDRWAIVAYIRALQKVKSSSYNDAKKYLRSGIE